MGLSIQKPKATGKSRENVNRTSRACDRCRRKKAKCDGSLRCKTCLANSTECTYLASRRREAKNYYLQMSEVTDEALQRLYWACRRRENFPGDVPDESKGQITTNAILRGLGLVDGSGLPQLRSNHPTRLFSKPNRIRPEAQTVAPSAETKLSLNDEVLSVNPSFSMQSPPGPRGTSYSTSTSPGPLTPGDIDMCEQFEHISNQPPPSLQSPSTWVAEPKADFSSHEDLLGPLLGIDAFLEMSPYTLAPVPQSSQSFANPTYILPLEATVL